jgi:membrane protein DedA with SNARE-associated domain
MDMPTARLRILILLRPKEGKMLPYSGMPPFLPFNVPVQAHLPSLRGIISAWSGFHPAHHISAFAHTVAHSAPVLFAAHFKYSLLFLGIFFSGESVLLFAIYLSIIGIMDIWIVTLLAVIATIFAETIWYIVGTLFTFDGLRKSFLFKQRQGFIDGVERMFEQHAFKLVFYSKFIYGFRTIVSVLSGVHRIDIRKYILINATTTILITGAFTVTGLVAHNSLASFKHASHMIELAFGIIACLMIVFHIVIHHYFIKKVKQR